MDSHTDRFNTLGMSGAKDHRPSSSCSGPGSVCSGATAESTRRSQLHSQSSGVDDDTNPLFISAVRIFLDFVRDKHGVATPEKTCSLEDLIVYLAEFQEEAKTKKGERYSPSTIRVIRYSLNRVIALGRNQQEMRPYPTQSNGCRRKRKLEEHLNGHGDLSNLSDDHSLDRSLGETLTSYRLPSNSSMTSIKLPERDYEGFADASSRFPRLNRAETTSVTECSFEPFPETTQSVLQGVKTFRSWLSNQGFSPVFEISSPSQLNDQLVSFYRFARNNTRSESTRSSLQSFRFSISHYLKKQAGIDIQRDPEFESSREAYRSALKNLTTYNHPEIKRQTFESTFSQNFSGTEWLGIPVDCIKSIYRSGALSTSNTMSLQRKVWFELTIFFRGIPCCPDQAFWSKNTFKVSSDGQGIKYVELNPDMYSRYGHVITPISQDAGRIMVQRSCSPFCPVASFETYLAALSPTCENLFPSVLGGDKSTSPLDRMFPLYTDKPVAPAVLSRMMETIAEGASLSHRFSCLSVAETDHVAWMRALTALEIELQCQAMVAPPEKFCVRKSSPECPSHPDCRRSSVIQTLCRENFDSDVWSSNASSRQANRAEELSQSVRPCTSRQCDAPAEDRFSWKKKLKMAFKDQMQSSQSDMSDGSSGSKSPMHPKELARSRAGDTNEVFYQDEKVTNRSPDAKQAFPAKPSLYTCPDKTTSCACKDSPRDSRSPSWTEYSSSKGNTKTKLDEAIERELIINADTMKCKFEESKRSSSNETSTSPEAARPAVKRILDLYRKSSPSLGMEHLEIQNGQFNELSKHPESLRVSVEQQECSQPIIMVRPQITIISRGCGPIDGALLKQRIFDSIAHSLENAEWQAEIDDAVDRLRDNSLEMSSQHSSSIDLSPGSITSPVSADKEDNSKKKAPELFGDMLASQVRFELGSPSERMGRSEAALHNTDQEYSDEELEESPKLHIDDTDLTNEHMQDCEEGDDYHGSHRRKAFLPTKHFE